MNDYTYIICLALLLFFPIIGYFICFLISLFEPKEDIKKMINQQTEKILEILRKNKQ